MTAAAAALTYSLSTVSDHVARLERQLACQLLDRTGGGCAVTDEGRRVTLLAMNLMSAHDAITVATKPTVDRPTRRERRARRAAS